MTAVDNSVLFVGALTLDTLYQTDDFSRGPGKYIANTAANMASGMATNAATAAARLGGKTALWASVGGDVKASTLVADIKDEGIDCSYIRKVQDGRSANAVIIVDKTGERWVMVDYDPITQAEPTFDEMPPIINFSAVMTDVRWPGAARFALDTARELGLFGILDADVASPEVLKDLTSRATHVVASAQGAEIITGISEPAKSALQIAKDYACFVCVTDGGEGSYWLTQGSSTLNHTPSPKVNVVDTNGAGDVFHGALALALAEGQTEEKSIQFASCAAALKCTVLGGRLGAPDRQKTLQLFKEVYNECY